MKEVLIYGRVYGYEGQAFFDSINEISSDSSLTVRVNTGGGDVNAFYGMIAKYAEFEGSKNIKVDGEASSMAVFFICHADKGSVECLDSSEFIVHRAAYPSYVESSEQFDGPMKQSLDNKNKYLRKSLEARVDEAIFTEVTGKTFNDIFSMSERIDVLLTAQQAKKVGLVDKINKLTPTRTAKIEAYAQKAALVSKENGQPFSIKQTKKVADNSETDKLKQKKMTLVEFKAKHPDVFAEASKEGAMAERDRSGALLAFLDADKEAVKKAIMEGSVLSQTLMAELGVKMFSKAEGARIAADSEGDVSTDKPEGEVKKDAVADFEKEFDAKYLKSKS